jgi:hypothetical protein
MSDMVRCSAGERLKSEKFKRFFVGWYVKAGRLGQLNLLSTCEVKLLLFNIFQYVRFKARVLKK